MFGANIRSYTKQRARHGTPFLHPPPLLRRASISPPPPPAEQFSGCLDGTVLFVRSPTQPAVPLTWLLGPALHAHHPVCIIVKHARWATPIACPVLHRTKFCKDLCGQWVFLRLIPSLARYPSLDPGYARGRFFLASRISRFASLHNLSFCVHGCRPTSLAHCNCLHTLGGMFARRAPGALLLDYVPPEEPPSTPLGNTLRIR